MFLGETGLKGLVAYSPWFEREANDATFGCDCIDIGGSGTVAVVVQHKNSDEADSAAATAATLTTITSTGKSEKRGENLKELIRYQCTVGGSNNTDWCHFRMLTPQWEDN